MKFLFIAWSVVRDTFFHWSIAALMLTTGFVMHNGWAVVVGAQWFALSILCADVAIDIAHAALRRRDFNGHLNRANATLRSIAAQVDELTEEHRKNCPWCGEAH